MLWCRTKSTVGLVVVGACFEAYGVCVVAISDRKTQEAMPPLNPIDAVPYFEALQLVPEAEKGRTGLRPQKNTSEISQLNLTFD